MLGIVVAEHGQSLIIFPRLASAYFFSRRIVLIFSLNSYSQKDAVKNFIEIFNSFY